VTRTIVVTGGATGIGRATAERFRADGDDVVITGSRDDVMAKTAAGLGARGVVCDATDPAQVQRLLDELPAQVDVLVNNAGGNTDFGRQQGGLAQLKANWLANLEANLLSAVLTTTALESRLTTAVVHLGSIAGARGPGRTARPRRRWRPGISTSPPNSARAASPRTWSRPASLRTRSSSRGD